MAIILISEFYGLKRERERDFRANIFRMLFNILFCRQSFQLKICPWWSPSENCNNQQKESTANLLFYVIILNGSQAITAKAKGHKHVYGDEHSAYFLCKLAQIDIQHFLLIRLGVCLLLSVFLKIIIEISKA